MLDDFDVVRGFFVGRLLDDISRGRVDDDIAGYLVSLNRFGCLFTTSSCSGRVVVIYSSDFRSKRDARILDGWHDPGGCRLNVCGYSHLGYDSMFYYWVSLQPPIIHFVARDIDTAEALVGCGDRSGFSKLGYRRYRAGGYHVTVGAGDKIHVSLPASCDTLLALCDLLKVYKEKLYSFLECTSKINC